MNPALKRDQTQKGSGVILISGVNGIGKTTVSHRISHLLDIRNCIGLGTIIKTLRATGDSDTLSEMDNYFRKKPSPGKVRREAREISPIINYLIDTYDRQGTDCIIEGVQLLPEFISQNRNIIHVHLAVGDQDQYRSQLDHPNTKRNRFVSDREFGNLVELDKALLSLLRPFGTHIIPNIGSIKSVADEVVRTVNHQLS